MDAKEDAIMAQSGVTLIILAIHKGARQHSKWESLHSKVEYSKFKSRLDYKATLLQLRMESHRIRMVNILQQ